MVDVASSLSPDEEARTLRWLIEEERFQVSLTSKFYGTTKPDPEVDAEMNKHSEKIRKMLDRLAQLAGV